MTVAGICVELEQHEHQRYEHYDNAFYYGLKSLFLKGFMGLILCVDMWSYEIAKLTELLFRNSNLIFIILPPTVFNCRLLFNFSLLCQRRLTVVWYPNVVNFVVLYYADNSISNVNHDMNRITSVFVTHKHNSKSSTTNSPIILDHKQQHYVIICNPINSTSSILPSGWTKYLSTSCRLTTIGLTWPISNCLKIDLDTSD